MEMKQMTNLKEARKKNRIEEFIQEHEKDAPGDKERLDSAIDRLAKGKKKSTQGTSGKDSP